MLKIAHYLNEHAVVFLKASTRDEALRSLVDQLDAQGKLHDKEEFYRLIVEREKIVSTGIGMGVAIPHAKLPNYNDFFVAVGILQKGVDWNAVDSTPVRIVFMIGGPDDKQTEYLQILSTITMAVKDEERRKKLLTLNSTKAIIQLFKQF